MKTQLRQTLQALSTRVEFKGRVRLVRALGAHVQPSQHPTLCQMPNGTWMMLNLGDPMHADIYYGLYETGLQQLVVAMLKPGMTFFDLGAHVGFYTVAAAQQVGPGGAVHAFEPLLSNAELLEQSIAANRFAQVRVNRMAVSDHAGSVSLHVPRGEGHNASGFATLMDFFPDALTETVTSIPLDDYVRVNQIQHIDLIKMDIEAAEVLALRGMAQLLQAADKPRILSEVNSIRLQDAGYAPTILYDILAEYGYEPYRVREHTLAQTHSQDITAPLENILFLPPADVLRRGSPRVIAFGALATL